MGPSTCRARTGYSLFLSTGAQHRVRSGPPAQSSFQNHLAMPRPQHLSAQQSTGSLLSHWFVSWQPGAFPAELLTFAFFFQMPWGRPLSASKKDRSQWRRETPSRPPAHTRHPVLWLVLVPAEERPSPAAGHISGSSRLQAQRPFHHVAEHHRKIQPPAAGRSRAL